MVRDYAALASYLAERAAVPFVWGSSANDCISFAAGAIRAQIGGDPIADLVWQDEDEAYALIEKLGGLVLAISAKLSPIAPAIAHRGDLAGVMRGNELGIMIVEGATLVGPGVLRAMRRPRSDMVMAWSIG